MNSLNDLIAERQAKIYGLNAATELAAREFGYADRIMREMDYADRIMRQIEPFPGLREQTESTFARYAQDMQIHDRLAQSLRPLIAEQLLLEPAYLHDYTRTLAQSQAILSQFTTHAVARQVATFDVSRIVAEINAKTSIAQAMSSFAERMIRDADLRVGLMSRLSSAYAAIPNVAPLTTFNYDELLRTIVEQFNEVGLTRPESLYHVVLWRIDGWLENLPPHVRGLFIAIIATLVGVVFQDALHIAKDALKTAPSLHEKHVNPQPQDDESGDMCR